MPIEELGLWGDGELTAQSESWWRLLHLPLCWLCAFGSERADFWLFLRPLCSQNFPQVSRLFSPLVIENLALLPFLSRIFCVTIHVHVSQLPSLPPHSA